MFHFLLYLNVSMRLFVPHYLSQNRGRNCLHYAAAAPKADVLQLLLTVCRADDLNVIAEVRQSHVVALACLLSLF